MAFSRRQWLFYSQRNTAPAQKGLSQKGSCGWRDWSLSSDSGAKWSCPAEQGQCTSKGGGLVAQRGKSSTGPALESSFALQIPLHLSPKAALTPSPRPWLQPELPACPAQAGFFIKRLRVLVAVHPPSVHRIAMRCHGNDRAPGSICCLCHARSRVLLIREATASPASPVPKAGWHQRMLHTLTAKAGRCVGCAAELGSAQSFSFLG